MKNDVLLCYFKSKLYEYCKENDYFYDSIDNIISIKHNDRRLRYEIKYDLFINLGHVERALIKIKKDIERGLN